MSISDKCPLQTWTGNSPPLPSPYPREPSLLNSFQYHLCGHQVWYKRKKPVSSSFYSFHWFAVHFTFAPPPYFGSLKCSFPSPEAQTHVNHNLNDKGSFIFKEFYASFNRNWLAFMHFISQLVWIHIKICFLIFFFLTRQKSPILHPFAPHKCKKCDVTYSLKYFSS